jgi:DNA mismatch repair ATPase MutS
MMDISEGRFYEQEIEMRELRARIAELEQEKLILSTANRTCHDTINSLERALNISKASETKLREALEHILEYWNKDTNERAMADALYHIEDACADALALPNDSSPLDALTKDAERYRWLRDCTGDYASDEALRITSEEPAENWDAAIDAAMRVNGQ